MYEAKTKPTKESVEGYLAGIAEESRRKDCELLASLMERVSGFPPRMWGTSSAHSGSVRSEEYRLRRMRASMPLLLAAILPALIQTRHFAHGLSGKG